MIEAQIAELAGIPLWRMFCQNWKAKRLSTQAVQKLRKKFRNKCWDPSYHAIEHKCRGIHCRQEHFHQYGSGASCLIDGHLLCWREWDTGRMCCVVSAPVLWYGISYVGKAVTLRPILQKCAQWAESSRQHGSKASSRCSEADTKSGQATHSPFVPASASWTKTCVKCWRVQKCTPQHLEDTKHSLILCRRQTCCQIAMLRQGTALDIVKSVERVNRVEAWRRLFQRHKPDAVSHPQ